MLAVSYHRHWHLSAMQRAAGNNVTDVDATKNKVTGATMPDRHDHDLPPANSSCPPKRPLALIQDKLMWLIFLQVIFVTMVYGPIAAFLVEAFPAKIRYTSLSLALSHWQRRVWRTGSADRLVDSAQRLAIIYDGLYYPITVAAITFVIGSIAEG